MENKRKNVYIIIFVITTIVAATLAVYFGLENVTLKNNNLKLSQEVNSQDEDSKNDNEVVEKKKSEAENIETMREGIKVVPITEAKIVTDRNKENINIIRTSRGITVTLNTEGKVTLKFVKPDINDIYPDLDEQFISKEYEFSELSDKIVDIQVLAMDTYGQDSVILFLLKNNTIRYITLSEICNSKSINGVREIEEINNVVRIDGFQYYVPASEGGLIPVAITGDGTIYDLYNKIVK